MIIKMIAWTPYEGWAFIIKDEQLYLLRPPYRSKDLIEVVEKDLGIAIQKHGFQECDYAFKNLGETIGFLRDKFVEGMESKGIALSKKEELNELLEFATEDILMVFLEKAEQEFIPQRNLDAAESIALALLPLELVIKNKELHRRTVDIIKQCQEERVKLKQMVEVPGKDLSKFPKVKSKFALDALLEFMGLTCQKQQLLQLGA